MEYTYRYDPLASSEENLTRSLLMDPLRAQMGPTATQQREWVLAELAKQNGHGGRIPPAEGQPIPWLPPL